MLKMLKLQCKNRLRKKKDSAFNKYNVNGEKRRGEGEGGH